MTPLLAPLASSAGAYFEPFLGGAAVFLATGPSVAYLADSNRQLIETYIAIRDHPEDVLTHISSWTNSAECYYEVREASFKSEAERAAQFVYLNRTCWNGLYRVNRQGKFNVPYGNNPEREIIDETNFRRVSAALADCQLTSGDFASSVAQAGSRDFVYLDPPYAVKGQNGFLRYNADRFSWSDQERLAGVALDLVNRGCHVALSNADSLETRRLFGFLVYHRLTRSSLIAGDTTRRKQVSEALFATEEVSSLIQKRGGSDG